MMNYDDGITERQMTPDELEANGYPRNFFDMSFAERVAYDQFIKGMNPSEKLRFVTTTLKPFEDTSDYDKDPDRFLKHAKLMVIGSYNSTHDVSDKILINGEEVVDQLEVEQLYIVWFAKTLQNWKALISTSRANDGLYFEVTYNGDEFETYVDTYMKEDNQVFSHHDN